MGWFNHQLVESVGESIGVSHLARVITDNQQPYWRAFFVEESQGHFTQYFEKLKENWPMLTLRRSKAQIKNRESK